MFAVHISNLIELPIHDKLKTTGRVQTSLKYFEEVYAHGKIECAAVDAKMTVDQLQKMMENATV